MSPDDSQTGQSFPEIDSRRTFINALIGTKIADRYEVLRILGEGGMGVVAEARHTELDQHVAIKFMFPEFLSNEILSARFSREAKLAAKVQSPHIVRVSDVGRLPSGVPYLVMDLLAGKDLGAELDEKGPLPVDRAVDYVLQAAAGIAALHAIGVVHRDLKPSNLFLADISGVPTVKVLDFGISKDVTTPSAALTSTDTQLGTPMYMSPEQIRASKNVDARSDVWSLGVILYELLTGVLPFERSGHSIGELFAVILMTDPVPLCMRRPDLPAALESVVMRCLRRTSWDRYDTVAALADALRPFARASSLHRIETVRRTLGVAEPSADVPAPDLPRSEQPTMSATPAEAGAATPSAPRTPAIDRPSADVKLEVESILPPAPRAGREPVVFNSLVSSSRPVSADVSSRRATLGIVVGLAAAVVGALGTLVIYVNTRSPSEGEPAASTMVAATPAPAPAPAPEPVPTSAEPPATAAPSSPRVAPAVVKPAVVSRPVRPPTVAAAPPPAPKPSATAVRTEDLILDRK
jgi:serine/threonine protein kinase